MLATLAILDAQVARYDDLPRTIDGLHEHCTDPKALDMSGMFGRCEEGTVVFIKGKYKGRSLDDIARTKPDYLEWMLRDDYFDDTKAHRLGGAEAGGLRDGGGFARGASEETGATHGRRATPEEPGRAAAG